MPRTNRAALVLCALALLAGCAKLQELTGESPAQKAEKRAQFILETVKKVGPHGEGLDFQTATCRWYNDKIVISDMGEFEWAYDHFRAFLREGGLEKGFQYSIEGTSPSEGSDTEFVVSGEINGSPFELVVPDRSELHWKTAPGR